MAKTAAMTPSEYLKSLPADRRKAIAEVRRVILDDLPLDVIGETIAKMPIDRWIKVYRQSRAKTRASRSARTARGTRAAAARAR